MRQDEKMHSKQISEKEWSKCEWRKQWRKHVLDLSSGVNLIIMSPDVL